MSSLSGGQAGKLKDKEVAKREVRVDEKGNVKQEKYEVKTINEQGKLVDEKLERQIKDAGTSSGGQKPKEPTEAAHELEAKIKAATKATATKVMEPHRDFQTEYMKQKQEEMKKEQQEQEQKKKENEKQQQQGKQQQEKKSDKKEQGGGSEKGKSSKQHQQQQQQQLGRGAASRFEQEEFPKTDSHSKIHRLEGESPSDLGPGAATPMEEKFAKTSSDSPTHKVEGKGKALGNKKK